MTRPVILLADPGIDATFAICLALADPNLNVLAVVPTAGNVLASQATANVHTILDRLDPPKRPRTATALAIDYEFDAKHLHGPDGLGGCHFPIIDRHAAHPADRVIVELIRAMPHEISVICLGPVTTLVHTLEREADLALLIDRVVIVGGAWRDSGDLGPRTEFHFALDPESTRRLFQLGLQPIVVPLDVTRQLVLSPAELLALPNPESRTTQLLREISPYGLRASVNRTGVEGLPLHAVLGVVALSLPGAIRIENHPVDIETEGELTRGMLVVDDRAGTTGRPNAWVGAEVALGEVTQYIMKTLERTG